MTATLADRIDAALPQTQCGRCGYDRCRPYAQALADGTAPINRCPPGGRATVEVLARLTSRPVLPLDPQCGPEAPIAAAWIDESNCIGCTLCIQACPVDAIVGAAKRMHTVVASLCTGCERCVAPCPVDCIVMVTAAPPRPWTAADADGARVRMQARDERLKRERLAAEYRLAAHAHEQSPSQVDLDTTAGGAGAAISRIGAAVSQAIARARQRRSGAP